MLHKPMSHSLANNCIVYCARWAGKGVHTGNWGTPPHALQRFFFIYLFIGSTAVHYFLSLWA